MRWRATMMNLNSNSHNAVEYRCITIVPKAHVLRITSRGSYSARRAAYLHRHSAQPDCDEYRPFCAPWSCWWSRFRVLSCTRHPNRRCRVAKPRLHFVLCLRTSRGASTACCVIIIIYNKNIPTLLLDSATRAPYDNRAIPHFCGEPAASILIWYIYSIVFNENNMIQYI